jgi:hypothetical protein
LSERFFGGARLTAAGILWCAASHTLFFPVLVYGLARLVSEPKPVRERLFGPQAE